MQFIGLYVIWLIVLLSAWKGPRGLTLVLFLVALVLNVALFAHHATTKLNLSF